MNPSTSPRHLALLLPDLNGGGVQRVTLNLAHAFLNQGVRVDLLLCRPQGHLLSECAAGLQIVPLQKRAWSQLKLPFHLQHQGLTLSTYWHLLVRREKAARQLDYLDSLADYLQRHRPQVMLSAGVYLNLLAVLARRMSQTATRLVLTEHSHFSHGKPRKVQRSQRLTPIMARLYPQADQLVAVSQGVADDLATVLQLPRSRFLTPHNPTLSPDVFSRLRASVDHPWFAEHEPLVLLTVGRLGVQKDFETLFQAVALVRQQRPVRLMVIGDLGVQKSPWGRQQRQQNVHQMIADLDLTPHVALLGYQTNPLAYMKKAAVFVLSSRFEGLPGVLLEALAAGCPIVSTDCPSGPSEILDHGRYGRLVPVGDAPALAAAIADTLNEPRRGAELQERAAHYDFDGAIRAYEGILWPASALTDETIQLS